ncbi:MAG: exosortase-associated EpsI family protein [Methanosarcinales archaeon]|nr:MAG: exosortase-associated EpsI family protein [Methanosarcinales archaeon]
MKSFFEEYSKIIGLLLFALVVILLFSTPSTFFAGSISTIDTELSHASGKEIMVERKLDFGNNEHMRAFPMYIGSWKGSDYNTERVAKSLGADVMLMRAYFNPESYQPIFFLIVQSGNRSSFHPPVICYPALGYTIEEESKEEILVHNVSWLAEPIYSISKGRKEEMGYFNGTISSKKLIVSKESDGNVTERRVVLYFYVKGGFSSNNITMIRVSSLAPAKGSYEGVLDLTSRFMGETIPYMFEPKERQPTMIALITHNSVTGKLAVLLVLIIPLIIIFYPQIRNLKKFVKK